MGKILVSIAAAQASRYIKNKKPSDLIPFMGKFPIIENYQLDAYGKAIYNTQFVEDCPEWVQKAIIKGQGMYLIEEGFKEYLEINGIKISEFLKRKNSEKSNDLIKFLNANSLSLDNLKV